MALSYWLRADVDDLLNEDTFFDSSDYSCLLEDTDWVQNFKLCIENANYYLLSAMKAKTFICVLEMERPDFMQRMLRKAAKIDY